LTGQIFCGEDEAPGEKGSKRDGVVHKARLEFNPITKGIGGRQTGKRVSSVRRSPSSKGFGFPFPRRKKPQREKSSERPEDP